MYIILLFDNHTINDLTTNHSINNFYLLPVTVKGKTGYYMYAIDVVRKEECLEKISSPCLADGGYLCVKGKMSVISNAGQGNLECLWKSKPLNFNSSEKKNTKPNV